MFQKATTRQSRLRLALIGPAGSGKTYSALRIAQGIGARVALLDTERGSASKYAGEFDFDVCTFEEDCHPEKYIEVIQAAADYDVLIIDSLSHAWIGPGGALELVDRANARSKSSNSFAAWRNVTPLHNKLVNAILGARCHVIATLRSKMEYVQEKDDKGRVQIRKVGLQPIQRDGLEYEFDVICDLDTDHVLTVGKTRCSDVDGAVVVKPGPEFGQALARWLGQGAPAAPPPTFEAQLLAATGDGEGAILLCLTDGRGDPRAWDTERQQALLGWLDSDAGRARLARWQRIRGDADAPHHTEFPRERTAFMVELTKRGLDYEKVVKPFCLRARMGKPSTWAPGGLAWFIRDYDAGHWPELAGKARLATAATATATAWATR